MILVALKLQLQYRLGDRRRESRFLRREGRHEQVVGFCFGRVEEIYGVGGGIHLCFDRDVYRALLRVQEMESNGAGVTFVSRIEILACVTRTITFYYDAHCNLRIFQLSSAN